MAGVKTHVEFGELNGKGVRVAIVVAQWNRKITKSLEKWCVQGLKDVGVGTDDITVDAVPGSFELPFRAKQLAQTKEFDVVVVVGCLIKGETMHFEYIAESVSHGLMQAALETNVPIIFGVLTCLTEEQAIARSQDNKNNHGYGWAQTAIAMVRK